MPRSARPLASSHGGTGHIAPSATFVQSVLDLLSVSVQVPGTKTCLEVLGSCGQQPWQQPRHAVALESSAVLLKCFGVHDLL
jgi:hypothetical protein